MNKSKKRNTPAKEKKEKSVAGEFSQSALPSPAQFVDALPQDSSILLKVLGEIAKRASEQAKSAFPTQGYEVFRYGAAAVVMALKGSVDERFFDEVVKNALPLASLEKVVEAVLSTPRIKTGVEKALHKKRQDADENFNERLSGAYTERRR